MEEILRLKNRLENIDVDSLERENMRIWKFNWAWIVTIKISKEIARKLKITKKDGRWSLTSMWSNWALAELEDIIARMIENFEGVYQSTYLT